MSAIAFVLPAPSEDATEVRAFVHELLGPRRAAFEESWRAKGVQREMAWLQRTPQGSVIIVYLEVEDPIRFYQELAASDAPFDRWYRQTVQEVYGVNLDEPPTGSPSELIAAWSS